MKVSAGNQSPGERQSEAAPVEGQRRKSIARRESGVKEMVLQVLDKAAKVNFIEDEDNLLAPR